MVDDGKERISEGAEQKPEVRELSGGLYFEVLAPLEHAFIGSSIPDESGGQLSPQDILKRNRNYYLRPLGLKEGNRDEINRKRKDNYLEGYLPFFEPDGYLIRGGYKHRLWLSELDHQGNVTASFRVDLINIDPKKDTKALKREEFEELLKEHIKITDEYSKQLNIEVSTGEDERYFTVSLKSEQTA